MKNLKNIYLLQRDFENSTFYLFLSLAGYLVGVLFFFSPLFYPHVFVLLLIIPFLFLLIKENNILFVVLYFVFFMCLGVLRTSFTYNDYKGLVAGKGYISNFVRDKKYYKQATIRITDSTESIPAKIEARFSLKDDINIFDEITFLGEVKKLHRYKNIQSELAAYESLTNNKNILKISEYIINKRNVLLESLTKLRQKMIESFKENAGAGKDFFIEVLFGERVLDDNIRNIFNRTGTAHILSISGLHFTLTIFFSLLIVYSISLIIPSITDFLPRQILVVIFSIPMILTYAFLSGLSIPAMRAFLFFSLSTFFLVLFKKKCNSFNLLFLVAIILIINDPYVIANTSFQLSFMSVFALLISFKHMSFLVNGYGKSWIFKILNYFAGIVFLSLIITFFILPVLGSFSRLNFIASFFANPFIIPLFSFIILPFLFLSLPFSIFSTSLFAISLTIPNYGWKIIYSYLSFLNNLPSVYLDFDFNIMSLILYYSTIFVALIMPKKFKLIAIPTGLIAILLLYYPHKKETLLVFPDVGQGDCAVVKTEEGRIIFIDVGGNVWDEKLGSKVYLPLMKKLGAKKIDSVILSHSHPDHMKALNWLGNNFNIGRVFYNEDVILYDKEILINFGEIRVYILPGIKSEKQNNRSNWVLMEYKNYKILFTGDMEKDGIEKMLRKYKKLLNQKITIIKVPHHGSKSSFSEALYKRLTPEYAVITVGKENPWNLPSREVIQFFRRERIKYLRTDEDGEIIFNLNNGQVTTYRSYYNF